jgi:transposase InsO family protein
MAWGTVNVDEQRMRFVVSASRHEKTMRELCQEFEISRPTGYEWLRRYTTGGIAGVVEKSRRPRNSPAQTAAGIEERVVELRGQRPDWGARKLQVLLAREGIDLPVITVHRILLRRGLVRPQDRFRTATERFERPGPNQLWQMDFKSPLGWDAPVGPLSVLDDHSRYAIALQGTWSTKAEPVKQRLIEAFQSCGVPDEMLMDHGTPWWNMKAVAGWTWLTVWIMRQGIQLHFSGYRHPQTQGKVERFHGALGAAMQRRGIPATGERQLWLDEFRHEYNHLRPHEALGMQTPAAVWSKSSRRYVADPPAWEYEAGAEVYKLSTQGQLQLTRRRWDISRALAGEWVQVVRVDGCVLVYYCRSLVRELDLVTQRSTAVDRWVS